MIEVKEGKFILKILDSVNKNGHASDDTTMNYTQKWIWQQTQFGNDVSPSTVTLHKWSRPIFQPELYLLTDNKSNDSVHRGDKQSTKSEKHTRTFKSVSLKKNPEMCWGFQGKLKSKTGKTWTENEKNTENNCENSEQNLRNNEKEGKELVGWDRKKINITHTRWQTQISKLIDKSLYWWW